MISQRLRFPGAKYDFEVPASDRNISQSSYVVELCASFSVITPNNEYATPTEQLAMTIAEKKVGGYTSASGFDFKPRILYQHRGTIFSLPGETAEGFRFD
jgi:hypothetical protein